MTFDYDVIVVGAGPGGSTAARTCAEAGLKTLVIEKQRVPRYKACGGCLSIKSFNLLGDGLGPVVENVVYGAKFTFSMKDPIFIRSREPIGYMTVRDRLDAFLVEKATEKGAELLEGSRAIRAADRGDRAEVELAGGKRLSCEFLIGADGSGSVVAASVVSSSEKIKGEGVGLECEVPLVLAGDFPKEQSRLVHLDFGRIPYGYGWVFPKREVLSVGVGGFPNRKGQETAYQYFLGFTGELEYLRGKALPRATAHRLPCFTDEHREVSKGRILLVGDAARMMDPLTGEGIYHALQSGRMAGEAIVHCKENGEPPAAHYQRAVHQVLFPELKWAFHLSRIIYSLTNVSYRTLKQYPELGQLCLEVLAGRLPYQVFVVRVKERIQGILRGRIGEKIRRVLAKPWGG